MPGELGSSVIMVASVRIKTRLHLKSSRIVRLREQPVDGNRSSGNLEAPAPIPRMRRR
ncbi:hypothetical protein EMIT0232MI5_30078 [Pseudomonas sp. IT-232MI5]